MYKTLDLLIGNVYVTVFCYLNIKLAKQIGDQFKMVKILNSNDMIIITNYNYW